MQLLPQHILWYQLYATESSCQYQLRVSWGVSQRLALAHFGTFLVGAVVHQLLPALFVSDLLFLPLFLCFQVLLLLEEVLDDVVELVDLGRRAVPASSEDLGAWFLCV